MCGEGRFVSVDVRCFKDVSSGGPCNAHPIYVHSPNMLQSKHSLLWAGAHEMVCIRFLTAVHALFDPLSRKCLLRALLWGYV